MLKALAVGIAVGFGITAAGTALAQPSVKSPPSNTPRMLLEYAARQHVGPGWQFLTGDPADIELLRRRLGFINVNPVKDADINSHTGAVRFGNERLERWCMAPGGTNPRYLATLVESALL